MNTKTNKFVLILIFCLAAAYLYMNQPINLNMRGGDNAPPKEAFPILFQYRFPLYVLPFLVIGIYLYLLNYNYKFMEITFADYGKVFLERFYDNQRRIEGIEGTKPLDSVEEKDNSNLVRNCKKDMPYGSWVDLICTSLKPCSCCGVKNYKYQDTLCNKSS